MTKKIKALLLITFYTSIVFGQQPVLQVGSNFPDFIIRPIINAPVKEYDVTKNNKKYLILNFWGTWCAPCIPEMEMLGKLQEKNRNLIHVIAISNETTDRLHNYLKKRPTKLWLASDTSFNLYHQLAFNYVGQSVILNDKNKIIALVRTDSINQQLIDKLKKGVPVFSSAEVGNKSVQADAEVFSADSTLAYSISLSSKRANQQSMILNYKGSSYEGRRMSFLNVPEANLYQAAYDVGPAQVIFEPDFAGIVKYSSLWCFDILVEKEKEDSIRYFMQQSLNNLLPLKARVEKRLRSVYVLSLNSGVTNNWKNSDSATADFWYSGKGFNGVAVPLKIFSDYLSNELESPIVDETGLTGKYDIKTVNDIRTKEEVIRNAEKLGLKLERTERQLDVLIIWKQ